MQLILNKINQQEKHWLIDEKKEDGFGALHLACLNNYYDVVKLFLENGYLNVNLKNANQQTPLHLAVERLNYDIVKLLLDFKCSPPACNQSNSTSVANLCANKLCNVNAVDKENDTPLHCLLRNLTILQLKKLKELNEKDSNVL
jgi:E3 ubiquitin-protein ligase mind-bomb